jgi:hypothetical protein
VQSALDQPADDRIGWRLGVHGEAAGIGFSAACRHRPVHGLDDVAAQTEFAQRRLEARPELPASRRDPVGQPQAFQLHRTARKVLVEAGARVI